MRNVHVPLQSGWERRDVWIEGGRYRRITPPEHGDFISGARVVAPKAGFLIPAAVDPHVHVREPGYDYKEDWESCSKAALKGGVCAIFDMPNNKEPVTRERGLLEKRAIALKKSLVDFGLYVALTDGNVDEIKETKIQKLISGVKIYMAETTGGLLVRSDRALLQVFGQPKPVLVHTGGAEGLCRILHFYTKAKKRVGTLPVLYICHLSTKEELTLVEGAKREFLSLKAEVTPHHLLLHRKNYEEYGSVLPNLGTPEDAECLWDGVARGTIDFMGTDHAPHTVYEKKKKSPPAGFPGIETAVPLLMTAFGERKLPASRLVRFTSQAARELFHLGDGSIMPKNSASCVLFEEGEWEVGGGYETKCRWSPFEGVKTGYRTLLTVVRGNVVYRDGKFNKRRVRFITA
ncbi:MAG: dihydroorotase family protein [Spirochaetes bacterium]|nr:dihydroorotase family protein [Spirochaetota bacterium]